MQAQTSEQTTDIDFNAKWKSRMEKSSKEALKHLRAAQKPYKRNYVKLLRMSDETIKLGDYVFLQAEKKVYIDPWKKLSPTADGWYLVKKNG